MTTPDPVATTNADTPASTSPATREPHPLVDQDGAPLDQRMALVETGIATGAERAEALHLELADLAGRVEDHSWRLEQRLALLDERVGRFHELSTEMARLSATLADQPTVPAELIATVQDRLEHLERMPDELDRLNAALSGATDTFEQRLDRIGRLATQTASDHEGFSEQLSEQVGGLEGRIAALEEAMARIDGLGAEIDRLAAVTVSEHNSTSQRVDRQLDAVLERLRSLEAQVAAVTDVRHDFDALAARTETAQHQTEARLAQRLDGFGAALHRHVQEIDRVSTDVATGLDRLTERLDSLERGGSPAGGTPPSDG